MIGNVAGLKFEAWTPAPRGGGNWVERKGPAVEAPPVSRGTTASGDAASNPQSGPSSPPATAGQPAPLGTTLPATPPTPGGPTAAPVASVPPATGIRLTLALADGTRVVRAFIVGGG